MCCCNTFSTTYVAEDTPVGPDIVGQTITFGLLKPSCLMMFIVFGPHAEGDTLTVAMSVWDDVSGGFMTINGVANLVITDTGAQVIGIPGGPRKINFTFTSTDPLDTISVGLSGLPQGYTLT